MPELSGCRITIVDNREIIRKGLVLALRGAFPKSKILGLGFFDMRTCLHKGPTPDIILMAVMRTDAVKMSDTVVELGLELPGARPIFYDLEGDVVLDLNVLKLGLYGFLGGKFSIEELLQCILRVRKGDRFIAAKVFDIDHRSIEAKLGFSYRLSAAEQKVVRHMLRGLRTIDIASRLNRKSSTVSTLKKSIFKKMHIQDLKQFLDLCEKFK